MQFGNITLDESQTEGLYLLMAHCSGPLANVVVAELHNHVKDIEHDFDRIVPVIEVEEGIVIQHDLFLGDIQ